MVEKVTLIVILLALVASPSFGAFENWGYAGRAMGLNGCYVALANDVNALLYNPAGIAQLERPEIGISYCRPFLGLKEVSFDSGSMLLALPWFEDFSLGLGAVLFLEDNCVYHYQENMILIGVAYDLRELDRKRGLSVVFGSTVKILSLSAYTETGFGNDDPVLENRPKTKFSLDAGTLLTFRNFRLGVSGQNLIPPDFGVMEKEIVPPEMHLGGGYDWKIQGGRKRITLLGEFLHRDGDSRLAFGAECELSAILALQIGIDRDNYSFGLSLGRLCDVRQDSEEDSGEFVSVPLNSSWAPRVDVSYVYSRNMEKQSGSPQIGLIWRF